MQMEALFKAIPGAVQRTQEIADRCSFSLDELRYEYPEELSPDGITPIEHLKRLTWSGAKKRYPDGVPQKVVDLLTHEIGLIEELHYEGYFLTVWDLVRFAREREILCQGRGSAANSAVCYCLGVTSVDPGRIDVLFERFVSKERDEAPDIDVDFEHERREEVLQYIYEKYGRERTGMTAEVITYRGRSAVRDVGKALGLSLDRVDVLARLIDNYGDEEKFAARFREAGMNPESPIGKQLLQFVQQILGFPRHLSQHVGGMVITQRRLSELVPIENASMPGRTVIQWDKDDLDALGILKVDCLSLGMLTAIRKCFQMIEKHHGRQYTLANVPPEDEKVYDMVGRADTTGVFQIESRAQMSMLPRLRPRCFYDLVIEVAIVRPGPIQGDMVHPYLRRRNGEEPVEYPNDTIREVLEKTLGVPIFQEQAMRLAIVAAGFSPGEADQLRRAMGAWRRRGIIDQFRQKLMDGMQSNGYSADFADRLFKQIRGFGEYGFPESHAASFALLVYVSCWLKHYYPAVFTASLINSQPMGFYAPAQLIADLKRHDHEVLPIDINCSDWDCSSEFESQQPCLRLGFRLLSGVREDDIRHLLAVRGTQPFYSFDDFSRRTGFSSSLLSRLSKANVFGSLDIKRREAMWQSMPEPNKAPLLEDLDSEAVPEELPEMSPVAEVVADYQTAGLSLQQHPMEFARRSLEQQGVIKAIELKQRKHNQRVKVAGLVLLRQRPSTASGVTFVTLEDETGFSNLIIRPQVWDRFHQVARRATAMIASGTLQRDAEVIHVLVDKLEDFSKVSTDLQTRSRDFR